jgi:RNA polymerase sigma-70 factor (ECF subfamily)
MKTKECSDSELFEMIRLGNERAFDEIHSRYAHRMYLYALNVLNKAEVCEDIVQNIFVSLWVKKEVVNIKSLKSYLFKAVKYQIFNYYREHKISEIDLTRLTIVDISSSALEIMEFKELEQIIHQCINNLPKKCQHIFKLSRYEDKSHKEIAESLDISKQTVKNQISTALKKIKENLNNEGVVLGNIPLGSTIS